MIISGAHMNQAYMHKLQAKKDQGQNLGSAEELLQDNYGLHLGQIAEDNPAKDGLTPAISALANAPGQVKKLSESEENKTLGETFADEMIRRMGELTDENGEVKDSSELEDSLGDTMDWLRERYGDETAAAAVGMIVQATSSGVNEDTLGEGLLNTLKFIDRNFGINAGDEAIAKFNSGINQELNNFFDNGKAEMFFDAGAVDAAAPDAAQQAGTRIFIQVADQVAPEESTSEFGQLNEVLDDLKAELDKMGETQSLAQQLDEELSPAPVKMDTAMAAYQAVPDFNEPQFASFNV